MECLTNHDSAWHTTRPHVSEQVPSENKQHDPSASTEGTLSPFHALLNAPNIAGRGNSQARAAALHNAQRTYGNRAVQRQTSPHSQPVQRSLADAIERLVAGGKPVTGGFLSPEEIDNAYNPPVSTGLLHPDEIDTMYKQMGYPSAHSGGLTLPPGYLAPGLPGGFLSPEEVDAISGPSRDGSGSLVDTARRLFKPNQPGPFGPAPIPKPYAPFGPGSLLPPMPGPSSPDEGSKFKSMDDLLDWGGSKLGKAADFVADNPGVVLSLLGGGFGGDGKEKETGLFDDPLKWAGETADLAGDDPLGAVKKAWQHTPLGYAAKETNEFFTGETTIGPDGKPRRGPSSFDRGVDTVFNTLA